MPLFLPPSRYKTLYSLVETFNRVPENDKVQQLFNLQQINYVLNTLSYNEALFRWVHCEEDNSWQKHLSGFGINPYASFFLKGHQFAIAVMNQDIVNNEEVILSENAQESSSDYKTLYYQKMQERDLLFSEEKSYEDCGSAYIDISRKLKTVSETSSSIKNKLNDQQEKLDLVQEKIEFIIYNKKSAGGTGYQVIELGDHVNNYNFILKKDGWTEDFIARVEDREDWEEEQILHTYPVSDYFIEDYAGFMMAFNTNEVKPVAISQRAQQGSLQDVAQKLKMGKSSHIPSQTEYYFIQLIDFCKKLIESGHYHPDIKLTNFLVDRNRIRVSDRKTIIKEKNPLIHKINSSPLYAPPEFLNCLNFSRNGNPTGFKVTKRQERANMDAFMAYQLGMALKEFLILTQMDELPDEFLDPTVEVVSYFESPSKALINYSVLIQELTRENPDHRLSISKLQKLLSCRNLKPELFYKKLEKILPSNKIGLQDELAEITRILNSDKPVAEWLPQANAVFESIDNRKFKEPRLNHKARELALKCFAKHSKPVFKQYVDAVEAEVLEQDWNKAPGYRKLLHVVTFGLWRVERKPVDDFKQLKIKLALNENQFKLLLPQLSFMDVSDLHCFGKIQAQNFYNYISSHSDEIQLASGSSLPDTVASIGENGSIHPEGSLRINENLDSVSPDGSVIIHGDEGSTCPGGSVIIHEVKGSTWAGGSVIIHGGEGSTCPGGSVIIHGDEGSTCPSGSVIIPEAKDSNCPAGSVIIHEAGDDSKSPGKLFDGENKQSTEAKGMPKVSSLSMFNSQNFKPGTGLDSVRTTLKRNGSARNASFRFRDLFKPAAKIPDLPSVTFNPDAEEAPSTEHGF